MKKRHVELESGDQGACLAALLPTSKVAMYCGYTSYAIEQANTIRVSMAELTSGLSRHDDSISCSRLRRQIKVAP
jgi:hypothetical protein